MSTSPWPPPGTLPEPRPGPTDGYRSPIRLARLVLWMVAIGMLVAVAAATVGYAQLRTFDQELAHPGTVPAGQLTSRDNWREVATAAVVIVLLVWWGLLIAWTHRLYRNLEPLGFRELRYGSGWAVGGWFVPFLNVARPKQVVNDIWRAGDPALGLENDFHERPTSGLLAWWWLLWLVLLFFSGASLFPRTDDLRGRSGLGSDLVWTAIFELAFGALTLLAVMRTTARQTRLAGDESPDPHNDRVVAILVGLAIVALLGTLAVNVFLRTTLPDRAVTSVGLGGWAGFAPGALSVDDVKPGHCFDGPEWTASETDFVSLDHLDVLSCGTLHDNEVFAVVEHSAPAGQPYPGDHALARDARKRCIGRFDGWTGTPFAASILEVNAFQPDDQPWRNGNRSIICFAFRSDLRPLNRPIRGSGL